MSLKNLSNHTNKIILVAVLCLLTSIVSLGQGKVIGSESDLIAALINAKSADERKQLLEENQTVDIPALAQRIIDQAVKSADEKAFNEAIAYASLYSFITGEYGTKNEYATALYVLASIYYFQGNTETAFKYFDKSAETAEEAGEKSLLLKLFNFTATARRDIGDYEHSLTDAEKGLKLSVELKDKEEEGKAQFSLGAANYMLGDFAQAIKYYEDSKETFQKIDHKIGIQTVIDAIGTVYGTQGNYAQSVNYYKQSIALAESIDSKSGIALSANNLGVIYFFQGNYRNAVEMFLQSLKIAEEIDDKKTVALDLGNTGIAYFALGDNEKSLEYSHKSFALAEQLGDKERISESLNNIAQTLNKIGNFAEALSASERAITVARQIKHWERLSEAHLTAGKIYSSLKRFDKAKENYDQAITILELLRSNVVGGGQARSLFLSDKISPYHLMIDLLQRQRRTSEAFVYAEKARGRVLLDLLKDAGSKIKQAMTGAEKEIAARLKKNVSNLTMEILAEENKEKPDQKLLDETEGQLLKARQQEEDFLTRTYAAHTELKRRDTGAKTITLAQTNDLLKNQSAAALEYVWSADYVGLFVITPNEKGDNPIINYFRLQISPEELGKRIEKFVKAVTDRRADFDVSARNLYEALIPPAALEKAGKNTLCLIPDGLVWKVPFQALQKGDRFLIEDYAVFSAPSLSVLNAAGKSSDQADNATDELLIFANPSFSFANKGNYRNKRRINIRGKKLTPLPEAENEGKAIVRMFSRKSKLYLRAEAQESRFKKEAANYKILHFAAHGFFDDADPMYSYLVLAPGLPKDGEDGLLTANEIMSLDLNADMAILSACDTAVGEYRAGEGVIGMTWAFMAANVPTIVSSQWSVETTGTTKLMIEYYSALKSSGLKSEGGAVKAKALRQAQMKLLKNEKYSLPYYWAGFTVIGSAN
jgi:CHAT domain-containing protein